MTKLDASHDASLDQSLGLVAARLAQAGRSTSARPALSLGSLALQPDALRRGERRLGTSAVHKDSCSVQVTQVGLEGMSAEVETWRAGSGLRRLVW